MIATKTPSAEQKGAPLTPEQSATAVIKVIDGYDLSMTGKFMRHTGEEAAW